MPPISVPPEQTSPERKPASVRVSVIVAAYNAELFIGRAITSALDQAGVEIELLIVDDGSSDGTADLVARLAAADDRVKLIRQLANAGPSSARNAGIEAATGDWAAVLDADDAFLPGRLAHLIAAGERAGADIVADGFLFYDAAIDRIGRPGLGTQPAEQLVDLHGFVAGARPFRDDADLGLLKPVFRLSYLRDHRLRYPVDVRHGEDFALIFEALLGGARYLLCRQPFYLYTGRESGLSRTKIDYGDQIARVRELQARPAVAADARLLGLLDKRVAALYRLQTQLRVDQLRGKQAHLDLAAMLLTSRDGWRWLARVLTRRLRRLLGRS